jgi:radical SAM superfamily enzyme YgiQ (UPF0313 family)
MAKVVFCQRIYYALFGLMSISAVLKANGHDVELFMNESIDKIVKGIIRRNPHVVAFTMLTATGDFEWSLEIARRVKEKIPQSLVVFGGGHPSLFPDGTIAETAVDVICVGEGEFAMLALCDSIDQMTERYDIPNLWIKTKRGIVKNAMGNLADLDTLPFPDRELYDKYGYYRKQRNVDMLAGRGCPYRCSFCYNRVFMDDSKGLGQFVRKHSVDYMIRRLREIKVKYKPEVFRFMDELFVIDKDWLEEFAKKYKEQVNTPFSANVRVDIVTDETMSLLARAGATHVCLGIETGNEDLRMRMLNKKITNAQIRNAAGIIHAHGIKFLTSNMTGIPGETVENSFETIRLNREIKTDVVWHSVFQPYPKLKITEELQDKGCIAHVDPAMFETTYFKGTLLRQEGIKEQINIHKLFGFILKFPRLEPFFRVLIKFPPNPVFEFAFMISYAWLQMTFFNVKFTSIVWMGLKNVRGFYRKF